MKILGSYIHILLFAGCIILLVLFLSARRNVVLAPTQDTSKSVDLYITPVAKKYPTTIKLPGPKLKGAMTLEEAVASRRSRRIFSDKPVALAELGQILWSAQGITDKETGKRTTPSSREAYPYTIYVVIRNASGVKPGLYEYLNKEHALGDANLPNAGELLTSAGVQDAAQKAPVVYLITASYGKASEKIKNATQSSTLIEAGHIGQNIYLQTESMKMSTVVMGGFDSKKVVASLQLDPAYTVIYVVPFGHRSAEEEKE